MWFTCSGTKSPWGTHLGVSYENEFGHLLRLLFFNYAFSIHIFLFTQVLKNIPLTASIMVSFDIYMFALQVAILIISYICRMNFHLRGFPLGLKRFTTFRTCRRSSCIQRISS
jgi:hypothetical protein